MLITDGGVAVAGDDIASAGGAGADASDDSYCYGSRTGSRVTKPLHPKPPNTPQQELPAASLAMTSRQTCVISKAEERGISLLQVVRPLECVSLVGVPDERCL